MKTLEEKLVYLIKEELPLCENPYAELGKMLGVTEEKIVNLLRNLQSSGKLKRVGAILRHQKSGFHANAMAVFYVEEDRICDVGHKLADSSMVSHCYERVMYSEFPYNLYAMIHSKDTDAIEKFVTAFVEDHDIKSHTILYSMKELKKTSMKYVSV